MSKRKKNSINISPLIEKYNSHKSFSYGNEYISFKDAKDISARALRRMKRFIYFITHAMGINTFQLLDFRILKHEKSGDIFIPIQITNMRFWITAKGILDDLRLPNITEGKLNKINIVSGFCLFSKEFVKAIAQDGTEFFFTDPHTTINKKIQTILVNSKLSLYEIESVFRLSLFINLLIKSSQVKTLFLNIPNEEYYAYILAAYNKGYVNPEQAYYWFNNVDSRNKKLFLLMKEMTLKDIPQQKAPQIIKLSPLSNVKKYIRNQIYSKEKVRLEHLCSILQKKSILWNELIKIDNPHTWIDLNNLSYVHAELYPGFINRNSADSELTVMVENPMERKILINARKILKEIKFFKNLSNIIGFYPHEAVITSDGKLLYDTSFDYTVKGGNYISQKKFLAETLALLKKTIYEEIPSEQK